MNNSSKFKWIVLAGASLYAPAVFCQSFPSNTTPPWKSYTDTHNPNDMVKSTEVAQAIGKKVDATNGQSLNEKIENATLSNPTLVNANIQASSIKSDSASFNNANITSSFTLPYADFTSPQYGDNLGIGSHTYFSSKPFFRGYLTLGGANAPIIHIRSVLSQSSFDIWQDKYGNANLSSNNSTSGVINLFAHNVNIGGSSAGSVLSMYGTSQGSPFSEWQSQDGQAWIQNYSNNINISSGSKWTVFSSTVQFGTSSITTDNTKCGNISGSKGCLIFRDPNGVVSYAPYFQ